MQGLNIFSQFCEFSHRLQGGDSLLLVIWTSNKKTRPSEGTGFIARMVISPDFSPGNVTIAPDFSLQWVPATESIVVLMVEEARAHWSKKDKQGRITWREIRAQVNTGGCHPPGLCSPKLHALRVRSPFRAHQGTNGDYGKGRLVCQRICFNMDGQDVAANNERWEVDNDGGRAQHKNRGYVSSMRRLVAPGFVYFRDGKSGLLLGVRG